jgi:hypothetical protein
MKTAIVITVIAAVVAVGGLVVWNRLSVRVESAPTQQGAAPLSSHLPAGDFDNRRRLVPPGGAASGAAATTEKQ